MNVFTRTLAVMISIFILLTPSWILLSGMTSGVRLVWGQCDQGKWSVDSVLGTYWFCVAEDK